MREKDISVFVPVFNEEANIGQLYQQLHGVLNGLGVNYEIIFIDDHSSDPSFNILKELAGQDPNVKLISFKRNYGQTAAMQAGFENSSGRIIISIDADLQNDPADIPLLIDKMNQGYDVVCGWRKNRKDKFISRRIPSIAANWLISKITGLKLHDYGCTLRAYRVEAVKAISLYGDMHRFIPVYAFWEGASVAEIAVNHRKRKSGKSKYNISRTYKVLLDLLTIKFLRDYSTRPSYLFGGIGLILCLCAGILAAVSVAKKILFGIFIHKDPLMLFAVMFFLMGTFCILEGLLAEIIIRFYHESTNKPIYSIKERVNF